MSFFTCSIAFSIREHSSKTFYPLLVSLKPYCGAYGKMFHLISFCGRSGGPLDSPATSKSPSIVPVMDARQTTAVLKVLACSCKEELHTSVRLVNSKNSNLSILIVEPCRNSLLELICISTSLSLIKFHTCTF